MLRASFFFLSCSIHSIHKSPIKLYDVLVHVVLVLVGRKSSFYAMEATKKNDSPVQSGELLYISLPIFLSILFSFDFFPLLPFSEDCENVYSFSHEDKT